MSDVDRVLELRYRVRPDPSTWVLPEGTVPESVAHDEAVQRIKAVLAAWAERAGRPVRAVRNLAIRYFAERPNIGVDPDVCLLDPPPPDVNVADLTSVCLWKDGHAPPSICFEVVSPNHPYKDYRDVHLRYVVLGTRELVVVDPLLAGPDFLGGPVTFQVWRPDATGAFERVVAGNEPVFLEVLDCWLSMRDGILVFSDDREGTQRWLTAEERERADKERALARVAELEAKLDKPKR